YHLRGMAAFSENDFEKGEEFYLKSLKYTLPDYKGKSLKQVPEINQVFAENHLGVILEALTYYYIAKYRQADDVHFLETANQYALRSLDLAEYIRHKKAIVSHENDKPGLLFQSWNYGMAIETAYLLYEKTGDEKYKNQAFYNLEKIKSLNLVQAALNDKLARKVDGFQDVNKRYKDLSAHVLRKQEQTQIARHYATLRQHAPFKNAEKELATANVQMSQMAQETSKAAPEFYNARIRKPYAYEMGTVQKRSTDKSNASVSYSLNIDYDFKREAYMLVVQNDRTDFPRTTMSYNYETQVDSLVD